MILLKKTIVREIPRRINRQSWVVAIHPTYLELREKGRRRRYPLSWEAVWRHAMEIEVERIRKERKEKRRAHNR